HAGAHLLHELVGSFGFDVRAGEHPHGGRGHLAPAAQEPQERGGRVDVAERGDVAKQALAVREERRAEDGKSRVLRSAHLDGAGEPLAAPNPDGVHVLAELLPRSGRASKIVQRGRVRLPSLTMRIALTHNLRLTDSVDEAEFDLPETIEALAQSLASAGHAVARIEVSGPASRLVSRPEALSPARTFYRAR